MLVVIPRGLPRTGLAIARLAIVVRLLAPAERELPPATWEIGYVGHDGTVEPWPGPHTPYRFVLHFGGQVIHVVYSGPDPRMVDGDEVGVEGRWVGGQFVAERIDVPCDFRDRECFLRHPEQLHGRPLPPERPEFE